MTQKQAGDRTIADIDALRESTSPNWDSYDAEPVGADQCERAKEFVRTLRGLLGDRFRDPIVSPVSDPGIALTWRSGSQEVTVIFTYRGTEYASIGLGLLGHGSVEHGNFSWSQAEYKKIATALLKILLP
jgi:hypothetical protein